MMEKDLIVVFLILGVILSSICVFTIRENCFTTKREQREEDKKYKESSEDEDKEVSKSRISPPVHSMLELMMKCPEEFDPTWEKYYESGCWKHTPSSTCFVMSNSWSDEEHYYINNCPISKEEGEYLLQGAAYLEHRRELKQEQFEKELRHKVDRKIKKVLEEKEL